MSQLLRVMSYVTNVISPVLAIIIIIRIIARTGVAILKSKRNESNGGYDNHIPIYKVTDAPKHSSSRLRKNVDDIDVRMQKSADGINPK